MNKNIKLAVLSSLTLLGGSWVAAQQEEPARRATVEDEAPRATSPDQAAGVAARAAEAPRASAGNPRPQNFNRSLREGRSPNPDAGWASTGVAISDSMLAQVHEVHRMSPMSPEEAARMRAFQDAIRELRTAKSEDDKAAARKEVTDLVSEQLDADLENREKELAAIEQRAKELRKQLDERKTAKPELLKMLVMLIDNPQVGLGIPPEWMQMLMRGQSAPNRTFQAFGFASPDTINFSTTQDRPAAFPPAPPARPSEPIEPATRY